MLALLLSCRIGGPDVQQTLQANVEVALSSIYQAGA